MVCKIFFWTNNSDISEKSRRGNCHTRLWMLGYNVSNQNSIVECLMLHITWYGRSSTKKCSSNELFCICDQKS